MNIPIYEGQALSMMTRVTDMQSDPLWTWGPIITPLQGNLENIDALIADGYEPMEHKNKQFYLPALLSRMCDGEIVRPTSDSEQPTLWARAEDIASVKAAPVILAFQQHEKDTIPEQTERVEMLQFLPLPRIGQWGLIDNGNGELLCYPLTMLPEDAKDLAHKMGAAIQELAEPGIWVSHTQAHQIAGNELTYLNYTTNYRSLLLQPHLSKADREEARRQLQVLERSHEQVLQLRQSWMKLDWLVQWMEIRKMAQTLASAYYAYHQAQDQQDARRDLPAISDTFINGQASMWSGLPFQAYPEAASNAASGAGRWIGNRIDETTYRISYPYTKPAGTTTIHIQDEDKDVEMARDRAWQQVKAMGDLNGDVYLAIIVRLKATRHNRDKDGWTWIRADRILDYRGIEQKKDKTSSGKAYAEGHRIEDIADIARCIKQMKNTRVMVDQAIFEEPQPGAKRRKSEKGRTVRYQRESPLFQFGDVITKQQLWNYSNSMGYATTEVAWQVKESAWMEPFIQGTNRMEGRLLQTCLEYDSHNEKWEKRFSRYLMFHLTINKRSVSIPRNISVLLEELSLKDDIDERHPIRTKDRFEKAMERLKRDGYISGWRYAKDVPLPARKWLPTWLDQKVIFTAPIIVDGSSTPGALPNT